MLHGNNVGRVKNGDRQRNLLKMGGSIGLDLGVRQNNFFRFFKYFSFNSGGKNL
jgi:hypothetical protein